MRINFLIISAALLIVFNSCSRHHLEVGSKNNAEMITLSKELESYNNIPALAVEIQDQNLKLSIKEEVDLNKSVSENLLKTQKQNKKGNNLNPIFERPRNQGNIKQFDTNSKKKESPERETHSLAIGGFVMSLAGLLLGNLIPFIGILVIPGFILGIISLNKIQQEPEKYKGRGLAITSIVIGALLILAILLVLVLISTL